MFSHPSGVNLLMGHPMQWEMQLKYPNDDLVEHLLRFDFQASNNEAEYEALIAGLGLA